jgi:hypothetical protein
LERQVTKIDEPSNHTTDLEFHASGFVAKVGGAGLTQGSSNSVTI